MADDPHRRIILLNHLVSVSSTRNRSGHRPPTHSGLDLFGILSRRHAEGFAIEFVGEDTDKDDALRLEKNRGKNYVRIAAIDIPKALDQQPSYITLLIEFWDQNRRQFHVVHPGTYKGRPLTGDEQERGAVSAHVMVRLPPPGVNDEGRYRCVIESVPSISRTVIQHLLCRQLRRVSDEQEWVFQVPLSKPRKKRLTHPARYTPRLELHSDVGRKFAGGIVAGKLLKSMTFVKRHSRENTGGQTEVEQTEFQADVLYRISASDGPKEQNELVKWARNIRIHYETLGFQTKLSFKAPDGGLAEGDVSTALDGATDLLMCPREYVAFDCPRDDWEPAIRDDVKTRLMGLLDKDELWERSGAP